MKFITVDTPDGEFNIIINLNDVALASGFSSIEDLVKRLPAEAQAQSLHQAKNHPYEQLIRAYYSGDTKALNKITRKTYGTAFQKKIWQVMSQIPYGETLSYKELANNSGYPDAIRAAGMACKQNRLTLLIPCHRILKSDGTSGNYFYGTHIKNSLLKHENSTSRP